MIKRFKEYEQDPKIRILADTLRTQLKHEHQENHSEVIKLQQWPFPIHNHHSSSTIHHAVYMSPHARDWQVFRIALKGFSTKQKLYHLRRRYREALEQQAATKCIQIDNYINALIRGGQLDTSGKVRR